MTSLTTNYSRISEESVKIPSESTLSPNERAHSELLFKSIPYRIHSQTLHDPQKAPEDLLATITYLKRTYPKIYLSYRKTMGLESDEAFSAHLIEQFKKGTCYGRASSLMKQLQYHPITSPIDHNDVFYYQIAQTLKTTLENTDYIQDILVTYPLLLADDKLKTKVKDAEESPAFDFSTYRHEKLQKIALKLEALSTLPKAKRDEEKRLSLFFKSGILMELNPDSLFEEPSEALKAHCYHLFNRELQKEMKKFHKDLPIETLHASPSFSSHASVETYELQFKQTAAHFLEAQELSGCVWVPGHVFSFQYSPRTGHFYIDNWGIYQYPDEKSFFEGLKTQVELSLSNNNIHAGNPNDPREEAPHQISFAMRES